MCLCGVNCIYETVVFASFVSPVHVRIEQFTIHLYLSHSCHCRIILLRSTVLVNLHIVLCCLFPAIVTWIIHKIPSLSSFRMAVRRFVAVLWCQVFYLLSLLRALPNGVELAN
jgi:hypothetical protein